MLRNFLVMALAFGGLAIATSSGAHAQGFVDDSCAELWYQRNVLYKSAGYCFKTARAIRTFGNAGCLYDSEYDLPLSPGIRRTIEEIRQAERYKGCPR